VTAAHAVDILLEAPLKPLLASWDDVDWSRSDDVIARQMTSSRAIVKRNRENHTLRSFGVHTDWCTDTYCKPQTRAPLPPPDKSWHEY